tara:strand:- start:576 stop:1010 length:435 start_codon:yes stop_codon:yes gene_type:complete
MQQGTLKHDRIIPVSLTISTPPPPPGQISLADLANTKLLIINRMSRDIFDHFMSDWQTILETEGIQPSELDDSDKHGPKIFSLNHPHLLNDLHQLPSYRHIDVIVYSTHEGSSKRSFATVFNTDIISETRFLCPEKIEVSIRLK